MSSSTLSKLPLCIIYGVGRNPGLGFSLAKTFLKTHDVAIVSRSVDKLQPIASELRALGWGDVKAFGADADPISLEKVMKEIELEFGKDREVRLAVWNASNRPSPKSFLDVTDDEMAEGAMVNFRAPSAFARLVLPLLLRNASDETKSAQARGALLFTGATASLKGSARFAAFAPGKFALRAVAQSIAREFGPAGIHAAHVIVDGLIDPEPEVAKTSKIQPDELAEAYRFLAEQNRTCFTFELDLRPGEEKF